jgi:hypothetical protein
MALAGGLDSEGELKLEGPGRIDGHFDGEITTNDSIIIGESAMITGDIRAVSIIVSGTVRGDITGSERIEICPSAKVLGNLTAPQGLGQGAQDPEVAVSPERARMRRVVVPGVAIASDRRNSFNRLSAPLARQNSRRINQSRHAFSPFRSRAVASERSSFCAPRN